jgi:hypothetical protein
MVTSDESVNPLWSSLKGVTNQHRQLETLRRKLCDELEPFCVPPVLMCEIMAVAASGGNWEGIEEFPGWTVNKPRS